MPLTRPRPSCPPLPHTRSTHRGESRGAFTLIELLVVLGIIAILLTLSITVGRTVTRSGEDRLTRDMIRVLDTTLTAWYADKESKFPGYLTGDLTLSATATLEPTFPIIDGRVDTAAPIPISALASGLPPTEPTLAAYLLIASESASVDATLKQQIEGKYLATVPLRWTYGERARYNGQDSALTVLDAWGRPIRFVHPLWHGGYGDFDGGSRPPREVSPRGYNTVNYSRSHRPGPGIAGDGDEGICPSNRPYFYSVGRDWNPGTREDNVYTTVPSFPPETATAN